MTLRRVHLPLLPLASGAATRTVYSVDWDWFTGAPSDVSCAPKLCGWACVWSKTPGDATARPPGTLRAAATTTDRMQPFLAAARIQPGAEFYVAENHAQIVDLLRAGDSVLDWDHHCDEYHDPKGALTCATWRRFGVARGAFMLNRLEPSGDLIASVADAACVFLCRSSPWTPQSADARFYQLIQAIAARATAPRFIGLRAPTMRRAYAKHAVEARRHQRWNSI